MASSWGGAAEGRLRPWQQRHPAPGLVLTGGPHLLRLWAASGWAAPSTGLPTASPADLQCLGANGKAGVLPKVGSGLSHRRLRQRGSRGRISEPVFQILKAQSLRPCPGQQRASSRERLPGAQALRCGRGGVAGAGGFSTVLWGSALLPQAGAGRGRGPRAGQLVTPPGLCVCREGTGGAAFSASLFPRWHQCPPGRCPANTEGG